MQHGAEATLIMCRVTSPILRQCWVRFSRGVGPLMRAIAPSCLLLLCGFALSGCVIVPYPHTTQSSPEIRGRILDETTHNPVGGAEISVHERPSTRVVSDTTGQFLLPVHHNFHWFITASSCADDLPHGLPYCDTVDIRCRGYATVQIDALRHLAHAYKYYGDPMVLRDVLLVVTNR